MQRKFEKIFLLLTTFMVVVLLFVAISANESGWWVALFGWMFAAVSQSQVAAKT